ncbi:MAG TPA: sulfotransferase [Acidimicrobiales bacterium]|nr:sulfotransferase [Acidimicrobiales bacterium]
MSRPGPIFLAGVDRSGIGLLGELLDAHPEISISRRTNFWSFYYGRFGPLGIDANLDRCLDSLGRYTRIRALTPEFDAIKREFDATADKSYGRLFALIQSEHASRRGKRRWGDKSLDTEGHAATIFDEYVSARIVHVMRDPRDRFASQSDRRQAGRGGVGSGTALWQWSAALAECNRARFGDRYLVVRFEDLVCETEQCLRSICEFIGEPYSSAMIAALADGEPRARDGAEKPRPTLRRTGIGRYERELSARQVAFIESRAARPMSRFGYQPSHARGRAGRVRYVAIDRPMWSAGAVVWRLRRRLGERSEPSPRRVVASS